MSDQTMLYAMLIIAALIVAGLAFYAGKLLFQLKHQTQEQKTVRDARIRAMTESIRTISMAMHQQQCNLSEGVIRLVNLLESLPISNVPNCERDYPSIYALYKEVRNLPTHEARKALSKLERQQQDSQREEHEARLEDEIIKEIAPLQSFQAM